MKQHFKILCALFVVLLMMAITTACGSEPAPTTEPTTAPVLSVTYTPGMSLESLEEYPSLESADLRGCEDYEGILSYIAAHPEVDVTYEVALGDRVYGGNTRELTFEADETPYENLLANLKYLPDVSRISLPETELTAAQMTALAETYPHVTLDYSVSVDGHVFGADTTEADCSWLTPELIPEMVEKFSLLPALETVELMHPTGVSTLTPADVKELQSSLPEVFFRYSFNFFGQTLSTSDERVEFDRVDIGNENEDQIRLALDILTSCTYFKLDDCGVSTPVMASIRDDYPDVKVVWRVHVDHFNMLTDETVLRLTHRLTDSNVHDLKYCTDTVYLDIGHNKDLTDISFVQYMPNLECFIFDGYLKDLNDFANCKKLVWMELCFVTHLADISALKDHPTLKYLNISYTSVTDLSPLDNVKLERLNCLHNRITDEQIAEFNEKHPDCMSVFVGGQPYGYGWRYNDHGYTFFDYYKNMRVVFRYDDENYWGTHREN